MTTLEHDALPGFIGESYPDRERWIKARRLALGGSDVPALLGLSSYSTPLRVWTSKVGAEPPDASTYSMRRGSHMEAFIADELAHAADGVEVERIFGHAEYVIARRVDERRLAYSPDALLRDPDLALGEWKSQIRGAKRWDVAVPLDVQAQCQHGMYVMGLPACYVAVDLGHEMRWERIERDPLYGERVVPALLAWWDRYVVTETPPPPTAADGDVLAWLHPEDHGGVVTLPNDLVESAAQLEALEDVRDNATEAIDEIKNRVKAALGDATRGELPDGSGWTWKLTKRKGFTVAPTEFRQLRWVKGRR